jgi:hypothetical protein
MSDGKSQEWGHNTRLLGSLGVLWLVLFLGDCKGGLTRLREQACIYKTGNPSCNQAEKP